ncbi:IclR family transcriptional regulator C-terminal domain-containing protein [Acidovorax sp. SUPP2539]|uniref:IclR family transcriptional regulator domain-containing protein n=1 Tax=Acidovorax sp. SUPP2539 TaxID=2920878 RepID=UPI0023DE3108|nr:IclR family transcriptional regulator C-terminal domain-containing protein [Acidovorax sp. SUPP2539]GKS89700.1 SMP-30/gluconolactonase/LRE family protein [Acidovorax sp. SUPP2539]
MPASPGDGTAALEKALDVLDAVGAAPQGLSHADLAARLALPRTTAYRLLATLVARGMLRRDPLRKVYCLGVRCFELARQAHAMPDLAAAAVMELRTLRDLTGETTYLAALDGRDVVSLERCDGAHSQRSASALGQRKPVYCTSQGKAILSAMDGAARDALVRELVLRPVTPRTLTDRRRLLAELRVTAARGYAIDDEEIVPGVRCVGAPIIDGLGQVRGALSVAGPAWRLTPERLELLGPEVAEAARRVGAQLHGVRPTLGDAEARPVPGPWAFHGAHPRWCAASGRLFWADTLAPALRAVGPGDEGDTLWAEAEGPVHGLLLGQDGSSGEAQATGAGPATAPPPIAWCAHGAFALPQGGPAQRLAPWPALPAQAVCRGAGGELWLACETLEGGSAVGCLRPGAPLEVRWRLPEPVQCLRWRAADGTLWAAVPDTGAILSLQPETGAVRRLVSVPKGSGRVSGLALDAEGGVWTALRDGWSVVRFLPDGSLDRVVALPVPCPTDVELGGADGRRLFITTARQPVPLDVLAKAPLSGRLFEVAV